MAVQVPKWEIILVNGFPIMFLEWISVWVLPRKLIE